MKFSKSVGSTYKGAHNGNKKTRAARRKDIAKRKPPSNKPKAPKKRCCDTSRNEAGQQCKMSFTIFLSTTTDNHFYLSSKGTLAHTYHPPLPMKAISQKIAHLDTTSINLIHTLFNTNASSSAVSKTMEELNGKESARLKPSTLYNYRNKYEAMQDILDGVPLELSDTDKTQARLDQ